MTDTQPLGKFKRVRYAKEWDRLRKKYGPIWVALARGSGPRADRVDHLFSVVLFNYGERYYAFTSEAARDAFVASWDVAEACQDPLP